MVLSFENFFDITGKQIKCERMTFGLREGHFFSIIEMGVSYEKNTWKSI